MSARTNITELAEFFPASAPAPTRKRATIVVGRKSGETQAQANKRAGYVYACTVANEEGTEATVVKHVATPGALNAFCLLTPYGGGEGPVRASQYPIGHIIKLVDEPATA